MTNKKTGEEVALELFDSLNSLSNEKEVIEGFLKEFEITHRTLQQAFGRLVFEVIFTASKMYRMKRYDLRNEAFCEACFEMEKMLVEKGLNHLPLI